MSHISQLRANLKEIAALAAFPSPIEGGAAAALPSERPIHAAAEVFSRYAAQTGHPLPGTRSQSDLAPSIKNIVWSYLPSEEQDRLLNLQALQGIQAHKTSVKIAFPYAASLQISSTDPRSWQPISSFLGQGATLQDVLKRLRHSSNQIRLTISNLDGAQLKEVFAFLEHHHLLGNIYHLEIANCPRLQSIAHFRFPHLRSLRIKKCHALQALPSLDLLTQLQTLGVSFCRALQALPSLDHLAQLQTLDVSSCDALRALPSLDHLAQLQTLDVLGCNALRALPSLDHLAQLQTLRVRLCRALQALPSLDGLAQLQTLYVGYCDALQALPSLDGLTQLQTLDVLSCHALQALPSLDHLTQLQTLRVRLCHALQALPSLDRLTQLQTLYVRLCHGLQALPSLDQLTELQTLEVSFCHALQALPSLDQLTQLQTLDVSDCHGLQALPSLDRLNALKTLNIACRQLPTVQSLEDYRRYLQRQRQQPRENPPQQQQPLPPNQQGQPAGVPNTIYEK